MTHIEQYHPGDQFDPIDVDPNGSIQAAQDQLNRDLKHMSELSGEALIFFYFTQIAKDNQELDAARINTMSTQIDELTNINQFLNMLKDEFNAGDKGRHSSDGQNPLEYHDYTEVFLRQLDGLYNNIQQDSSLPDQPKENLLNAINHMHSILEHHSIPSIWNDANNPTDPNQANLKSMLSSFSELQATVTSVSQTSNAKMQYFIGDYNTQINMQKGAAKIYKQGNQIVVDHIRG